MGRAAILIIKVISVLPDVEGQDGIEAVGDGVVRSGILGDCELAFRVCLEPYPAGSEEGRAFSFEVLLEGGEGAPLGGDLLQKHRFFAALRMTK